MMACHGSTLPEQARPFASRRGAACSRPQSAAVGPRGTLSRIKVSTVLLGQQSAHVEPPGECLPACSHVEEGRLPIGHAPRPAPFPPPRPHPSLLVPHPRLGLTCCTHGTRLSRGFSIMHTPRAPCMTTRLSC